MSSREPFEIRPVFRVIFHDAAPAGKPPADRLLKGVRRKSKRGQFLDWLLEEPRTIGAAVARYRVHRRNVFVNLWFLNSVHGIGYNVTATTINLILPNGATAENIWR